MLSFQSIQLRNARSRTIVAQRIHDNIALGRSNLAAAQRMLDSLTLDPQGSLMTTEVRSTVLIPGIMIENSVQSLLGIAQDLNRLQVATIMWTGIPEYNEDLFDEGEGPSEESSE